MITGSIKNQVDSIWNAFWSGGISNPMEVIELYEPPFTGLHHQGLDGAFRDGDAEAIVEILAGINRRAAA